MIHARGLLTGRQVLTSMVIHYWHVQRRTLIWMTLTLILLLIVSVHKLLAEEYDWATFVCPALLLWYLMNYVINPMRAYRKARRDKDLAGAVAQYTIGPEGLNIQRPSVTNQLAWSAFQKVLRRPNMVLLYLVSRSYLALPRNFFATDEDWKRFRLLVIKNAGHCPRCEYCLRECPSDTCPECGLPLD